MAALQIPIVLRVGIGGLTCQTRGTREELPIPLAKSSFASAVLESLSFIASCYCLVLLLAADLPQIGMLASRSSSHNSRLAAQIAVTEY